MVVLALKSLFTLMAPHKRFVAWQECHKLVLLVYKATETLPRHELYGLTSHVRRVRQAVPSRPILYLEAQELNALSIRRPFAAVSPRRPRHRLHQLIDV